MLLAGIAVFLSGVLLDSSLLLALGSLIVLSSPIISWIIIVKKTSSGD